MDQPVSIPRRRGRPSQAKVDSPVSGSEPAEKSKVIVVAVVGAHPINCYPLRKVLYPNSEVELEDHPWVRKQIKLGTLQLIG